MMLPYVWMVGSSFKAPTELSLTYFTLIPKQPTLRNFVDSVRLFNIGRYFYNSIVVSGTAVLLQTTVCALAAYALARFEFPGAGLLLVIFIGTMMVPEETIMVPLFLLFRSMGLLNTYGGMILPIVPWGFSVYLLTQFFREIPKEIEESAYIDGASHLNIFLRIILPLSKPALGAIFISFSRDMGPDGDPANCCIRTEDGYPSLGAGQYDPRSRRKPHAARGQYNFGHHPLCSHFRSVSAVLYFWTYRGCSKRLRWEVDWIETSTVEKVPSGS